MVVAVTLTLAPLWPDVLLQVMVNLYEVCADKPLISSVEAVVSAINSCPPDELYLTTYLTFPKLGSKPVQLFKFIETDRAVTPLLQILAPGLGGGAGVHVCVYVCMCVCVCVSV